MTARDDTTAPDTEFEKWVTHFTSNRRRHDAIEAEIDGETPARLPSEVQAALVRSFQRFELGEGGDGLHLLRKAEGCSPAQREALRLLVAEEQEHSALFRRGLRHLGPAR